jgi:hypothetical protein
VRQRVGEFVRLSHGRQASARVSSARSAADVKVAAASLATASKVAGSPPPPRPPCDARAGGSVVDGNTVERLARLAAPGPVLADRHVSIEWDGGRMRVLERLRGQGELKRQDTGAVLKVRYRVDVLQEEVNVGNGETIDSLKDLMGHIDVDDRFILYDWAGEKCTLFFGDGRCVDGFVRLSGSFRGSGAIYEAASLVARS